MRAWTGDESMEAWVRQGQDSGAAHEMEMLKAVWSQLGTRSPLLLLKLVLVILPV